MDHIDRDKSNNRIENLRLVDDALNSFNQNKVTPHLVPGIRFDRDKDCWCFRERQQGARHYFHTWEEVIRARHAYEIETYGESRPETQEAFDAL